MAASPSDDPATLGVLAKLFRGFGDPTRLTILLALRTGPLNVSEVVGATGLSQPTVSTHLSCLWCCGLVERRRTGRYVYYRLRSAETRRVLARAMKLVDEVRDHVEACERYDERRETRDAPARRAAGWA